MRRDLGKILLASVVAWMLAGSLAPPQAFAATLHAFCIFPTPTCTSNGTVTPTTTNPPHFGFLRNPNTAAGDFFLEVLIPDNVAGAAFQSFTITGTNTANPIVASVLYSSTPWTS